MNSEKSLLIKPCPGDTNMTSSKEQRRRVFWDELAGKADENQQYARYMLGLDDYDEALFISESDVSEIMGLLPDLTGMEVLELASGIGRFVPGLAQRAKHVVSTDFTESFVEKNKKVNGPKFPNVTFRTLDVTRLDYPSKSFDCVFLIWVLMFLTDEEVRKCAQDFLRVLRPGGFLFFRESHFTSAIDIHLKENAGEYRTLKEFRDLFKPARFTDEHGDTYYLEHIFSGNSQTYTKLRNLPTVIHYLWKKTKVPNDFIDQQLDLDSTVYSDDCMKVYNRVIGNGFSTPGGLNAAKKWLSCCDVSLSNDDSTAVLDVGCGTGGLTSYLIQEHNVDVTSVDLSMLACEATILRLRDLHKSKGHVKITDLSRTSFPPNSFDYIMVKETLEFLKADLNELLKKFQQWLKPNGFLLIGGYFFRDGSTAANQLELLELNPMTEGKLSSELAVNGFSRIKCVNLSDDITKFMDTDLKQLKEDKALSFDVKDRFVQLWSRIMDALKSGELQWMALSAVKHSL